MMYHLRSIKGLTGIEIGIAIAVLGGVGFITSKLVGSGKKNEGRMEEKVRQNEAVEEQKDKRVRERNQYLFIQQPKRRNYKQVTSDPEATPEERANATFDLFGDPKGK